MEQLTELDYTFIQMESNRTPMHITPIMFYDQSGVKGGKVRFKDILQTFERNLHKSKIFRRKLAGASMGFDTPYWIEDPDFDLEFHVRHISLPKPGDWRQLCILLARLHARGLDMTRPLWEAYVIEGLNEVEGLPANSFAIMLKVHHSAIDGVSGAEIVTAIHSLEPDAPLPPPRDDWHGEAEPSLASVWRRAYVNNLKRPMRLVNTVGQLVPNIREANRIKAAREAPEESVGVRTPFNAKVSPYRVTDALVMELARIKKIRQHADGATVNDVIVTVVSGAMRKYLQAHDALPEATLSCAAPINVRVERNSESKGNQVGVMTVDMATDVEDPLERLQAVMQHAKNAKETSQVIGTGVMMDITRGLSPQVTNVAKWLGQLLVNRSGDLPMPMHTIISNVPGPQFPLYLAGARLHMLMGMGPLVDMGGLFHAVISGVGLITINFVSCRELLPDPDFYKQCLEESYAELEAATFLKKTPRRKRAAARRA